MSTFSADLTPEIASPPPTASHALPPAVRWGGAVLALCALTFTVTILVYVAAYGEPAGTGTGGEVTMADRAGHLLANWPLVATLWIVEATAWALLAIAAFVLQGRAREGPPWFPARAAWAAVAVGALIQSMMYAFTLGAYPTAAAAVAESPELYATMRGAATYVFNAGNAALYFGLAGAFLAESSPGGVVPRGVAVGAAVVCFATAALLIGLLAGMGSMMLAAPGALLGFLAAIYLGVSIWKRG